MDIGNLTPKVLEEMYEMAIGIRPKDYRYVDYDLYIRARYCVEVLIPRRKEEGDRE